MTLNVYDAVGLHKTAFNPMFGSRESHANANGLAETNERVLVEHEVINIDTSWQFMFYLNESGNAEGDAVNVFLEGTIVMVVTFSPMGLDKATLLDKSTPTKSPSFQSKNAIRRRVGLLNACSQQR